MRIPFVRVSQIDDIHGAAIHQLLWRMTWQFAREKTRCFPMLRELM